MDKLYIQITSGRGPAECCRVVARVTEIMMKEAALKKLQAVVIDKTAGDLNRTLKSVIMELCGEDAHGFVQSWTGVIQWISQSPYRKFHKRKNWFIGVQSIRMPDQFIEDKDICYQTLRASGPGGQHVNRTESAVRAIHRPSGISVLVSDQRSQHQNKKLATERLRIKLAAWQAEQVLLLVQDNWQQHNELERGNPIKVINMRLDS